MFRTLLISLLLFALSNNLYATHIRAGEILYTFPDPCNRNLVEIELRLYLSETSGVPGGNYLLLTGDGGEIEVPELTSTEIFNSNTGLAVFKTQHEYLEEGDYIISYTEVNRNGGIRNIPNSVSVAFHIESQLTIGSSIACNQPPVFLIPPIDEACGGFTFYHNPGAFDPDGDSLSYELVVPKSGRDAAVTGYQYPDAQDFYDNPSQGNENNDGPPSITIDPVTGLLAWNAPPEIEGVEEYNVAFKVTEWRRTQSGYQQIGFIVRDMQIVVNGDCNNDPPELNVPEEICITAGETINEDFIFKDTDGDSVSVLAFGQVFSLENSPASVTIQNNTLNFNWQTNCEHVPLQTYKVDFRVEDQPEGEISLTRFYTLFIKVIAPVPDFASIDREEIGIVLNLDPYFCENAERIEIWRRVDSNNFSQDDCETGIPEFSGYTLLDSLSSNETAIVDDNLAMGAKYCYRAMAIFENINGQVESRISQEICYEFVPADAPVLTHISIENTDFKEGSINVSWKKPYDLDFTQFTGDIFYDVYRSVNDDKDFSLVQNILNDTTFLDQGLNTEDSIYYYTITLRVPDLLQDEIIDTSAIASSIRLNVNESGEEINLSWSAEVPWNNFPVGGYHLIYKGVGEHRDIGSMELIDSVLVTQNGFSYTDTGESLGLEENVNYCYAVATRGTYGNPRIESPLVNLSQIGCMRFKDTTPPSSPELFASEIDCSSFVENYGCGDYQFQNDLWWTKNEDNLTYFISYAGFRDSDFQPIAVTKDTSYQDTPSKNPMLTSFRGCYKLVAVDDNGLRSDSTVICIDNCPNYELPNVITLGLKDNCNDIFSAFGPQIRLDDNTIDDCGAADKNRCARFVKSVKFSVFNRWGKEVYAYQSGEENSIFIQWDGVGNNGDDLPSGVYYYHAKVQYDVVDKENSLRNIKGTVHLLR